MKVVQTTHRLYVYDADDDDDDVDVDGVQHDSECFGIVYTETDMIRNVVCVVCAHYSHREAVEQYQATWANSDTDTHTPTKQPTMHAWHGVLTRKCDKACRDL